MSRCLVTGHKGYIGSKLFEELKRLGHEVKGIDLKDGKDVKKELYTNMDYFYFQPEYIFHLACFPRIGYSIKNPVLTMRNNAVGGSVVLAFAKKCRSVKRVIYSSSSSVSGQGTGPTSPYALQKLVTEMECKIYSDIYGVDTVSLRYFNVYSEDQQADGPYTTAVANWMDCIRKGERPFITGTGNQRRDMVHVSDVVAANIFAMLHSGKFEGQYFDIGTGNNISLNEVKDIVQKYHDVEFDYRPPRPGEVMSTKANTKLYSKYGFETCVDLETGLNRCFDFKVKK
tara:strand:+ start:2860 stop:3714 length:855 start_codon:yes stop_codon:yes gene_type:complete